MDLAELAQEIRIARLQLAPAPLPIAAWGAGPEEAMQRLLQWTRSEPPGVEAWLTAFEAREPLPALTAEESTLLDLRLHAALDALELIGFWERLRHECALPEPLPALPPHATRERLLDWLFRPMWHHYGFGKTADALDSLRGSEWPRADKHETN